MYSIIDIESNGAPYREESIIEIAIYRYDGHQVVDQFISMVNPESEITPFVQKLTSITSNMVKTAPKFHEIAKRIIEITDQSTLVGHNIDFDYRMLRQSFKKLGYDYKINTLDTIPLAKKLIPNEKSYSLSKLVKSLGIPLVNAHRASGDARATLDLFKLLINKDKDGEIIQAQREANQAKNYLNKIDDLTTGLPAAKGIFYMQNEEGKILYTKYSDDMNRSAKRILSSKSKRWDSIKKNVHQIHYELTGSSVLAQLILGTKKLAYKNPHSYGLFFSEGHYFVEALNKSQDRKALLKFKSYTQGQKVFNYIQSNPELQDINTLKAKIDLKGRDEIWTMDGRTLGEKAFIVFENGQPRHYGFYELYTQVENASKRKKLQLPIEKTSPSLLNDLKIELLKSDVKIKKPSGT